MAPAAKYGRALDRVMQVCAELTDARALRLAVLDDLRGVIPFDAYAWPTSDPQTSVGTAPLADVPCLADLPRLIRLKYLTDLNRWTGLEDVAVTHIDGAAPAAATRTESWSGYLAQQGVIDVASAVFRDRHGTWGWLDLWRCGAGGGRFSQEELDVLRQLVRAVTPALRRCQAATFTLERSPDLGRSGPAVLLLSPSLEVLGVTPHTGAYLELLVPPEDGHDPVPAGAYNVAAQLLASEAGVDANPPRARTHLAQGRWLTLAAARIGGASAGADADIAVTVEESSATERTELFARAFGFSAREAELLRHLVAGGDTRDVAARMFLSEHTVQDYLKGVFAKTSTHSRRAVVALAVGR